MRSYKASHRVAEQEDWSVCIGILLEVFWVILINIFGNSLNTFKSTCYPLWFPKSSLINTSELNAWVCKDLRKVSVVCDVWAVAMDVEDYSLSFYIRRRHAIVCNLESISRSEVNWVLFRPLVLSVVDVFVSVFPVFEGYPVSILILYILMPHISSNLSEHNSSTSISSKFNWT